MYNNYKDYPLYRILNKKRLFDDVKDEIMKVETKEEAKEEAPEVVDSSDEDKAQDDTPQPDSKEASQDEVVKDSPLSEKVSKEQNESQDKEDQPESQAAKEEQSRPENSMVSEDPHDNKSVDPSDTKEEVTYGMKKRFDQVLEDYEALPFEKRKELS